MNKWDTIKEVIPADTHIQKYETDLKPEGQSLVGSHHKHDSEGKRCFHLDREKQVFYCFHCGAGGSIVDYEADRLNITPTNALLALADEYSVDLPSETPETKERREQREQQLKKLIPIEQLMLEAFKLYHEHMNTQQRHYFIERGIPNKVIDKDLLGYAPHGGTWLVDKLRKVNSDTEALLGTGLFYQNRDGGIKDRYADRYIFPYWDQGKPVFSIGRSIDPNTESHKKYVKHLVKSDRYPFVNDQAVRHILWGKDKILDNGNGQKILVAEGIIDAIVARHYFGTEYIVISPVTSKISNDQLERLADLTTKADSVIFVPDSEASGAGEQGAIQSAGKLKRNWNKIAKEKPDRFHKRRKKNEETGDFEVEPAIPLANIARLRRPPERDKKDIADFIAEGNIDELLYWIRAAQPLDYQRQREKGDIRRFFEGKTTFVAKRMADECKLKSNFFLYTTEQLHRYQDGVYTPDGANFMRDYAKSILGEVWTAPRNQALIDWLQDPTTPDKVDTDPNTINVKNGLLDLQSGKLRQHNPYYLSTTQLPVEYKPNAAWAVKNNGMPIISPDSGKPLRNDAGRAIQHFITSVVEEDCIDLIYEMIGYCLSTQAKYDRGFILVGDGANGKGTLLNLISTMLGTDNISTVPAQDLAENRFKTAELFGKLANICADLPANPIENSAPLKMITSGDSISAERKHQQPFKFRPYATLLFSANEIPRSRDRTYAYYRRWSFIPFPNRFEGEQRDEKLIDKITTPDNLSALLALSIEGLQRLWKKGNFTESESANAIMDEYKSDNDNVLQFVDDCLTVVPGRTVHRKVLYNTYTDYCKDSGYNALSKRRFNKALQNHLSIEWRDKPRPQHWVGIDLN